MKAIENIKILIKESENIKAYSQYTAWSSKVREYLGVVFGDEFAIEFGEIGGITDWVNSQNRQVGKLLGIVTNLEDEKERLPLVSNSIENINKQSINKKIFIVHGHDNEAKESVARFIEKIGLKAVILHEQPSSGKTIIEKFENYSDASFAVILLTPDDIGSSIDKKNNLHSRSRQNVIFELGFFIGRIGRKRVCALYKKDVEIPSNYQGVIYIKMDDEGAWKIKLAKEFVECGISINKDELL